MAIVKKKVAAKKGPPAWAQKALEEQQRKGSGGDFMDLDDTTFVRILPSWKGEDEQFYVEGAFHYKMGPEQKTVACAKLKGKRCFFCEENERLWKKGDKDGAKKFRAKARFFANGIKLGSKSLKVETFAFGSQILTQVLQYLTDTDEEWGEWWHDGNRYDFKVTKTGKGLDTEYAVQPTRKFADVDTSDQEARDLEALASKPLTYAQMKAIYEGEDPDDVEDSEEDEEGEESEETEEAEEEGEEAEETEDEPDAEEEAEDTDEGEEAEEEPEEEAEEGEEAEEEGEEEPEEEEEAEAEEAEEEEPEAPSCFEDPMEHDPSSEICQGCDWRKECLKAVEAKIAKLPKKYADAPLMKAKKVKAVAKSPTKVVEKKSGKDTVSKLKAAVAKKKAKR